MHEGIRQAYERTHNPNDPNDLWCIWNPYPTPTLVSCTRSAALAAGIYHRLGDPYSISIGLNVGPTIAYDIHSSIFCPRCTGQMPSEYKFDDNGHSVVRPLSYWQVYINPSAQTCEACGKELTLYA